MKKLMLVLVLFVVAMAPLFHVTKAQAEETVCTCGVDEDGECLPCE